MFTNKILGFALIGAVLLTANPAYAKGGSGGSAPEPSPVLTTGSCDLANPSYEFPVQTALGAEWDTAIVNPNFPGGAVIHIIVTPTEVYATSICLEQGWTVKYKPSGAFGSRSGFDARFQFNGAPSVDVRYVFGLFKATYY